MICLFITIPVHGEVKTFERTTENNYGVNKKINIDIYNICKRKHKLYASKNILNEYIKYAYIKEYKITFSIKWWQI